MRGVVLSLSHHSSILLISLLVLSTHVLWAQRTSTLKESAVQLPDAPSQVATVLEAQRYRHLADKGLPSSLQQRQGQTESWMRFFPTHSGYDRLSINITRAVPNQDTGAPAFWDKNEEFIGSGPTKWITFAPTFGLVPYETVHGANGLEYYGRHIPWAGAVILQISQQAKAHPHITRALKVVHPRF